VAVEFWSLSVQPSGAPAVISDRDGTLSVAQLRESADRIADLIAGGPKGLAFILCRNTPDSLAAYLGVMRSGHAVCLLDEDLPRDLLNRLVDSYMPEWIFASGVPNFDCYSSQPIGATVVHRRKDAPEGSILPGLALILPTSGSTGSPKFVRLSYRNLQANACAIVDYLGITPEDRCITSLPMAYSYGLSILHTHLLVGAPVLMTTESFLQRGFWTFFREHRPTSLAGVPYHYETLLQMRMLDQDLSGLHTLTQAGGRLAPDRIARVADLVERRGWRFFVMYGQTEATARISYVPAERLREKIGSIGIPIRDGSLDLDPATQELFYRGPNVMLGYAERRADLSQGDRLGGTLATGDLARRDEDGYYYIIGRQKRFLKIFGKRFSLDEMETLIAGRVGHEVVCVGADDNLRVFIEPRVEQDKVAEVLRSVLTLHPKAFRIMTVDELPRLPSGKRDYQALSHLINV